MWTVRTVSQSGGGCRDTEFRIKKDALAFLKTLPTGNKPSIMKPAPHVYAVYVQGR